MSVCGHCCLILTISLHSLLVFKFVSSSHCLLILISSPERITIFASTVMEGSSSVGSSNTEMKGFEHYIPSSVEHERRYHIFLSFRGCDIRHSFAPQLHQFLVKEGFHVFLDDERLEKGENIWDSIEKAIRESTVHIPILSPNYATSHWCLKELSLMWSCKSTCKGVRIIPLFYNVDPSVVRYQKDSYAKAFKNYSQKGRHSEKEIGEWKEALKQVADLSGWHYKESSDETSDGLGKRVVKDLLRTLNINYFSVATHPVGIPARVEKVTKLLQLDDATCRRGIVGIWGMGGLGKTTLCKAIYNSIHHKFEAACFLFNIRATAEAKGLTNLQEQILFNLEAVERKLSSVEKGKTEMKNHLSSGKRALIILDDVDDEKQLDALVGDWYARGSRIIITTRDKQMLRCQVDMTLYPMEGLDPYQSLKLFSRHAFRDDPDKTYEDATKKIVEACRGLPLSLKIIGAHLCDIKDLNIWSEVLARIQALEYEDLYKSLRISYDALGYQQKQIFLDIACFFVPFYSYYCSDIDVQYSTKEFYTKFWKECGYKTASTSLQILEEKSLVEVHDDKDAWSLGMHDHLRDLGRRIVEEESMENPGKRSRLWCWDDIRRVMTGTEEMPDIRGLMLKGRGKALAQTDSLALMTELKFLCFQNVTTTREIKMLPPNLKYLIFLDCHLQENRSLTEALRAEGYFQPSIVLPKAIGQLKSLRFLDMSRTYQKHLPDEVGELCNLEELYLTYCRLTELPQNFGNLTKLKILDISPNELRSIPESFNRLKSLVDLRAGNTEIEELPALPESLLHLNLAGCEKLQKMPSMSHIINLETLVLSRCRSLAALHLSGCTSLAALDLSGCTSLAALQLSGCISLAALHLSGCISLAAFHLSTCTSLAALHLSGCTSLAAFHLSGCISLAALHLSGCTSLAALDLSGCTSLAALHLSTCTSLAALGLSGCTSLAAFEGLRYMHSLRRLTLDHCEVLAELLSLPESLVNLSIRHCYKLQILALSHIINLETLDLSACISLAALEGLRYMHSLRRLTLDHCEVLAELPSLPESLVNLNIRHCYKLQNCFRSVCQCPSSLETLDISCCSSLTILRLGSMHSLRELTLQNCEELNDLTVSNCCNLQKILMSDMRKLKALCLSRCATLIQLSQLELLQSLEKLTLERCEKLQKLSVLPGSLVNLTLEYCCELQEMPIMSSMHCLRELTLEQCENLEELPALPEGLINLEVRKCMNLRKLPHMSHMKKLETLNLFQCIGLTKLPQLSCMQSLREVVLDHCEKLEELPSLPESSSINLSTRGLSLEASSQTATIDEGKRKTQEATDVTAR